MVTESSDLLTAVLRRLNDERREVHATVLRLAEDLSEIEVRHVAGNHSPSIAFHVWHLARYADHDARLVEGGEENWVTDSLASRWGFPASLGESETGTEIGDEIAIALRFPLRTEILAYARSAFAALDGAMERVAEALMEDSQPFPGLDRVRMVSTLFEYPTHDNRHLGMIEALRGLLGEGGTATR